MTCYEIFQFSENSQLWIQGTHLKTTGIIPEFAMILVPPGYLSINLPFLHSKVGYLPFLPSHIPLCQIYGWEMGEW